MTERHLYRYEYVNAPFDDVARVLAEDAAAVLQRATDAAAARAREVQTDLFVDLGGFEVGREVTVTVGEFEPVELRRNKVHVHWTDAHHKALFPELDGELEVAALAFHPPLTQVSLVASYTPPLGLVGAAGDAMFGHRVAEAAIHRFLHFVVERIEERLALQDQPTIAAS